MILAVIGATLLGEEILTVAESGGVHQVRCFDSKPVDGLESHFRGGSLEVEPLVAAEIQKCDVVICATDEIPNEVLQALMGSATKIIDCCGILVDLPLVHPYIHSTGIEGLKVRIPHTNAAHLADVLFALTKNSKIPVISRVVDTILEPAGNIGHSGINELWQQGIAIYNHRGVDIEQFSAQIAFNCIPFGSTEGGTEGGAMEIALVNQVEFLCQIARSNLIVQMVRVPTYSATCHALTIFFESEPNEKEILKVFGAAPSIQVAKPSDEFTQPLTMGETSTIRLARLRKVPGNGIAMWLVADNTRIRAQMALDIAEGFLDSARSM